jgi:hypothetical protein
MPRITRSRAIARLIVKWLDHRLHHPGSVAALPLSKWLTDENIAATAALDHDVTLTRDRDGSVEHRVHGLPLLCFALLKAAPFEVFGFAV